MFIDLVFEKEPAAGLSGREPLVERDNPVHDRQLGAACKMREAADVRRKDHRRTARLQRGELVLLEFGGKLGLEDRVGSRRAATEMRIGHGDELESRGGE